MEVGILAIEVYVPCTAVAMSFCSDREDAASMALTVVDRLLRGYGIDPRDVGRLEVGTESGLDRSKSIKSHVMRLFEAAGNDSVEGVDCVHGCYGATAALFNAAAWVQSGDWDGRLAVVVGSDVAMYEPGTPAAATGGCGAVALLVGPDAPLVLEPARSWRSVYSGHADEFLKPFGAPHAYPVIDGRATLLHFLTAVDRCGHALLVKRQQYEATATAAATADSEPADRPASSGRPDDLSSRPAESTSRNAVSPPPPGRLLGSVDHFVCHAPFHRLVRKAFSRLHYQDLLHATHNWRRRDDSGGAGSSQDGVLRAGGAAAAEPSPAAPPVLSSARDTPPLLSCGVMRPDWLHGVDPARLGQASVEDRDLAAALLQLSQAEFEAKGSQAAAAQVLTGNSYTASLYTGLAGLVEWLGGSRLAGRRVLMFAFGSGVNASLFALRCRDASTAQGAVAAAAAATVSGSAAAAAAPPADVHDFRRKYSFSLARIAQQLQLERRLARRTLLSPREYDKACALHQQALLCPTLPYQPHGSIDDQSLSPGTWYLERIGEDRRRCYAQKPDGS